MKMISKIVLCMSLALSTLASPVRGMQPDPNELRRAPCKLVRLIREALQDKPCKLGKRLDLSGKGITDEDMIEGHKHLQELQRLLDGSVVELLMHNNPYTDSGVRSLMYDENAVSLFSNCGNLLSLTLNVGGGEFNYKAVRNSLPRSVRFLVAIGTRPHVFPSSWSDGERIHREDTEADTFEKMILEDRYSNRRYPTNPCKTPIMVLGTFPEDTVDEHNRRSLLPLLALAKDKQETYLQLDRKLLMAWNDSPQKAREEQDNVWLRQEKKSERSEKKDTSGTEKKESGTNGKE